MDVIQGDTRSVPELPFSFLTNMSKTAISLRQLTPLCPIGHIITVLALSQISPSIMPRRIPSQSNVHSAKSYKSPLEDSPDVAS